MINCLIVDDEPLAQDILATYVQDTSSLCLVKTCNTALEAFEVLHQEKIDLLFLDIKMPGLSGIDLVKSLKNPPAVIFTTAYSEYAAASYDLEAVDYLLKPITQARFDKALAKFLKLQPVAEATPNFTYFKVSGKLVKVLHDDILYAQSIKDYILLHTLLGNHIVHMTMKYLGELLPEKEFVRVHRSYLVNRNAVQVIGKAHLRINEKEIPIGESYKRALVQ
ncbi:LytR/AlgR family response regulator transcription factor [Pedobacter sp. ASV12]|uniref:LytR/AlgR family response regulator transcription factor n=1 Tax=Pedobacter sp. ASV12 TaxID=2795120 RepID=UPI0018EC17A3|nr:LytTR family DNA-binding domain-containing protein [Pedobacter sp. ASV12]